jgi:hypothetical protein
MSDGPFVCYKELVAPTNVERAVFFRRFNSLVGTSVEYLCVLSTTVISVYEVNTQQQQRGTNTSVDRGSGLSLKYHQKIFGKVNDAAAYRNNRLTDDDLLVLSIDIGKIVILDYDLKNNCFNIVLMCNVEENAIGIGSDFHFDTHGMRRPLGVGIDGRLEVCQENSLLCSVVYGKYLLFIPLDGLRTSHSDAVTDRLTSYYDYDEVINASGTGLRNNSQFINRHFTVDIAQSFKLFGPIIDICFVHGYSQPAMAILQQSGLLPVGHTARVNNSSTVTVLAIDTLLKSSTILWQKAALPSDSISLLKLSSRVFRGAIAVITLNALLVINDHEEHGIATNGFAGITVHKRIQLQSWLDIDGGVGLELDASKWIEDSYIAPRRVTDRRVVDGYNSNNEDYYRCTNSLLGILKDGSLLRIGLSFGVANDMLSSIIFKPEILMNTVRLVTCLSLSTYGHLIFIGSRQVECLLIGVTRRGEEESIDSILESSVKRLHTSSSFLSPTSKKKRSLQMLHDSTYGFCELMGLGGDNDDDDDDDDNDAQELELHDEDIALYSDVHISLQTMSNNLVNMSSYQLEVLDTIPCIGPILHGIYTAADPIFIQLDHLNWQQPVVINDASSPMFQSASHIPDKEAKDGLIIASGLDDGGSLLRVYQGLRLDKLTVKNLVGSTYIFSIPTLRNSSRSYGVLLIAYEGRTRVLHCQKQDEDEEKGTKRTRNDRGELQMKEMSLSDSGFNLYATTINAGILFEAAPSSSSSPLSVKDEVVSTSKTIVAQITHNGVRVIRLGKSFGQMGEVIQEVSLSESIDKGGLAGQLGERIIAGDVCQGYITLITSMHSLYVLSYDDNDAGKVIIVVKRLDSSLLDDNDRSVSNASALSDIIIKTSTVVSASLYRGILHFQSPSVVAIDHTQKMMDEMKDSDQGKLDDDDDDDDIFIYGKPLSAFANDDVMDTAATAATVEVEVVMTKAGESSPMTKQQQQHQQQLSGQQQQQQLYRGQDSYPMEEGDHIVVSQRQEKTYLIITDSSNELSIICLHDNYDDITCVFQSKEFANLKPFVANHIKNDDNGNHNGDGNNDHNNDQRQSRSNTVDSEGIDEDNDPLKVQGLIVETRCANLYELPKIKVDDDDNNDDDDDDDEKDDEEEKVDSIIHGIFTISFLLHTGDLVIYSAYNTNGGPVLGFHRSEVYPNTNKKSGDTKQLFRSYSNEIASTNSTTDPSSPAASNVNSKKDYRGFLSSSEYLNNNNGPMLSLIDEINGRSAVLVAGNEPLIITTVHGLPSIYSIGLPEIPCINYGLNIVVSFCIKDIKAIASLWIEFEDIQSIKNPTPTTTTTTATGAAVAVAVARSNRECLLGIYQQIPSLELYPHSNVSIKRTVVGKTVHKLAEILNRTGDRTQQALLEKKTVVLLCSEECQAPFLPSVLTEAEFEEDGELYERYFTALESFSPPDESLGRPPYVMERMHSLTLLQLGNIVDTYWFPRNESIVDMEVLYFNLHKSTSIPGMYAPLKTLEQRVYVAACTTVIDKRGEDTQGKGRLLLFGIDYALFEADEEEDEDVTASAATAAARDTSGTVATATNASVKGSSGNESSSIETKGGDKGDKRSSISMAQAKFLGSIKPKLKLLWSGTGPASIIRQLGEYVLTTVGSIVYVYKFNPDTTELEQVAFYYAQIYITSVSVVKNYIILADMFHSIQLLYWRAEDYSLNFVSKDYDRSVVPASSFIIDGNKLAIVAADDESNIQLFQENPRYSGNN